jgi:hypothetical protein
MNYYQREESFNKWLDDEGWREAFDSGIVGIVGTIILFIWLLSV